jgi:hypothetical protein
VPDEPEITRTSPSGMREGYEKYSAETSAAIKSSCEAAELRRDKRQLSETDFVAVLWQ